MEKKLPKKIEDELDFLEKASNDELCEYLKNLKKENTYNLEYHPKIKKIFTKIFNNKNKNVKLALIKYYPESQLAERFLLESSDKILPLIDMSALLAVMNPLLFLIASSTFFKLAFSI